MQGGTEGCWEDLEVRSALVKKAPQLLSEAQHLGQRIKLCESGSFLFNQLEEQTRKMCEEM